MSICEIEGFQLHYETHGSGQPLLFLHGAYLTMGEWEFQRDFFAGSYRVVLCDLPGHGDSDKLSAYTVQNMAKLIASLMHDLDEQPWLLCGHFLGGMVAQQIAADGEITLSKLILAETSYGTRSTFFESVMTSMTVPMIRHIKVEKQAKLYASSMGKHNRKVYDYVLGTIERHQSDPANFLAIWQAVTAYEGIETLGKINCPTLIMAGEENRQTHKQARRMQETIPRSRLVFLEHAGHMLQMDESERFNFELETFLSQDQAYS